MKQAWFVTLSTMLAMFTPSMVPAQAAHLVGDRLVSSGALGATVLGQKIQLMMHDGTYVEGKVLRASQTEIHIQVKKCVPKERLMHLAKRAGAPRSTGPFGFCKCLADGKAT